MLDVAVIGAGMAGLVCARRLHKAGYRVAVVEKSRGLGGRVATRRLQNTCADHGVRYLENQGDRSQQLIEKLLEQNIIQLWTNTIYRLDHRGSLQPIANPHPRYVAPEGMTAIAKFLATDLEVWRGQRVTTIAPTADKTWTLTLEASDSETTPCVARSIVIAIPAPQAVMLVDPLTRWGLPTEFLAKLKSVEFEACLTAIATYPSDRQCDLADLPWRVVTFSSGENLAWVGLDSSKHNASYPIFVLQSSAAFADRHLEARDLQAIGQRLLQAAQTLIPWLDAPDTLQVHRWRYAFARSPLAETHLTTNLPLPLVCCGDWCGGSQIEAALHSGTIAAAQINAQLENRQMPSLI